MSKHLIVTPGLSSQHSTAGAFLVAPFIHSVTAVESSIVSVCARCRRLISRFFCRLGCCCCGESCMCALWLADSGCQGSHFIARAIPHYCNMAQAWYLTPMVLKCSTFSSEPQRQLGHCSLSSIWEQQPTSNCDVSQRYITRFERQILASLTKRLQ